jgi:hypothetical protein
MFGLIVSLVSLMMNLETSVALVRAACDWWEKQQPEWTIA